MSKLYFLIDDPLRCPNCPAVRSKHDYLTDYHIDLCMLSCHEGDYGDYVIEPVTQYSNSRPSWCPLRPVPEKIDIPAYDNNVKALSENAFEVGAYMYNRGHYRGYNLCIDKILGS